MCKYLSKVKEVIKNGPIMRVSHIPTEMPNQRGIDISVKDSNNKLFYITNELFILMYKWLP